MADMDHLTHRIALISRPAFAESRGSFARITMVNVLRYRSDVISSQFPSSTPRRRRS